MKIISDPREHARRWHITKTCATCSAELELDCGDVLFERDDEELCSKYFGICPVCRIPFVLDGLPPEVEKYAQLFAGE